MRHVELGSLASLTPTPIRQHDDDDDYDEDDDYDSDHQQQTLSNMQHNLVDEEYGPGALNDELAKTPVMNIDVDSDAHRGDSAHRASEVGGGFYICIHAVASVDERRRRRRRRRGQNGGNNALSPAGAD